MDHLDIIESYNPTEETINFGTRSLASGGNLYEAVTLCSIKHSSESLESYSHIQSLRHNDKLFLSTGQLLRVFQDSSCSTIIFNAKLDSIIDTFCISSKYLLICLRNGDVHLLDIESLEIISTKKLFENVLYDEKYFIKCFPEISIQDDILTFLIVCKQGTIFRIQLNFTPKEVLEFKVIAELRNLIEQAAYSNNRLLLNGEHLIIYDTINGDSCISDREELASLHTLNENQFIGVTKEGFLVTICAISLLVHDVICDFIFADLVFYGEEVNDVCYSVIKNEAKCNIRLLNFVDFSEVYSLKVNSSDIHLVQSENAHDEQMFISKVDDQEFRIQIVTETIPEKRLERLIRRQKLDEAESFAKLFNLDVECVMVAKAGLILDKTCNSEDITRLISILENVSDFIFKIKCCLDVSCDSFEDVRKILNYGLSLDVKKHQLTNDDVSYHITNLKDNMYKFDTYMILSNCDDTEFDPAVWHEFANCDLYDKLISELKHKNINTSVTLYSRLHIGRILSLNESEIVNILNLLDKNPLSNVMPFLCTFIPRTFLHIPSTVSIFVKWICDKVFYIENNDHTAFPDNAINFVIQMMDMLSVDSLNTINFVRCCSTNGSILDELFSLVKCLYTIQTFKNKFMVLVPLKECLKGPVTLVQALFFMDNVDVDQILINFLINYLLEHQFKPDDIFSNVIEGLVIYEQKCWIHLIPAIWDGISSTEIKLNTLKLVIKSAHLPWCDSIRQMIKVALEYKHPLVSSIELTLEREHIYIIFDKYNLKEEFDPITNDTDLFTSHRIIYCNRPTVIEDVFALCTTKEKKRNTTYLLIDHFHDNFSKTFDVLKLLSVDEAASYVKGVISLSKRCLEEKVSYRKSYAEHYIKVLDTLINKSKPVISEHLLNVYTDILADLKSVTVIRKKFQQDVSLSDIKNRKDLVLKDVLRFVWQEYQNDKMNAVDLLKLCNNIAAVFHIEVDQVLVTLCEEVVDLKFLCIAAEFMYKHSYNYKFFCIMVTLIMRKVGFSQLELNNDCDDSILLHETSITDTNHYSQCIMYGKLLATKAVLKLQTFAEAEIFNWIYLFNSLTGNNYCSELFSEPIYRPFSMTSIDALRCAFVALSQLKGSNLQSNCVTYLDNYEDGNPDKVYSINQLTNKLQYSVQTLCDDRNLLTASNLVICVLKSITFCDNIPNECYNFLNNILLKCNNLLVQKVFASSHIDRSLAFSVLLYYKFEKADKIIMQAININKLNLDKLKAIAEIGIMVSNYHNISGNKWMYLHIILLQKWWKSIEKCTIPYKEFFKSPRDQLLEKLIVNHFNIKDIEQFCKDFELEPEKYLYIYLKKILIQWRADYKIVVNMKGTRCLVMNNNDNNLYQECMEVISLIKTKNSVFEYVNKLSVLVNFYHYEVFLCILKILSTFCKDNAVMETDALIKFLNNYIRSGNPSSREVDEWFTKFPDTRSIDALSEWRLPFIPTVYTQKPWSILKDEINLKNYVLWFETLPILQSISKADICYYAVRGVVKSGLLQSKSTEKWILQPQHTDLLVEIDNCLQHISELDRATSVAYFLTSHIPQGADLVEAAKLCYQIAKKYRDSPDYAENEKNEVFLRVHNKFYGCAATHILHSNNLGEAKYLQMVIHPDDLIDALYNDERIIKTSVLFNCPDFNKTVDELAELFEINITEKRLKFLEDWLSDGCISTDNLDETVCVTPALETSRSDVEFMCLQRSAYICSSGDINFWQNHLISKGLKDYSEFLKYSYQARALKCLCAMTPIKKVEELTNCLYQELLYFIDKLVLLHDLQRLGVNVNIDTLNEYDKKKLLRMLSKNVLNPLNVKVMGSICTTYAIYDLKYWELIINSSIKLKCHDTLKAYIHFLNKEGLFYEKFYVDGWQCVIDHSFSTLLNYSGDDFESLCIGNMHQIQSCPVLLRLNLEPAYHNCLEIKRQDLAAWLVQYFPKQKARSLIKNMLINCNGNSLISSINNLYKYGLLGSHCVIQVIRDEIEGSGNR